MAGGKEEARSIRLAAPCLDGSAAHPVSPGPHQQRRRASAVHRPAHATIAPSDQRDWPRKMSRALKGGGFRCCGQAGGKPGPVGFHRLRVKSCPPIQCARGASFVKRRARRSAPERCAGPSASSAPLIVWGVTGQRPVRRGSWRPRSGSGSGEDLPLPQKPTTSRPVLEKIWQALCGILESAMGHHALTLHHHDPSSCVKRAIVIATATNARAHHRARYASSVS